MTTANVTFRLDEQLKHDAEELFSDLGLTLTGALTVFLRQSVREQRIPFTVARLQLNEQTRRTLTEVRRGENLSRPFHSVSELMADLNADD
ncbi:type II toxin-antitoxin system RelB/DinJ family antitoxin [Jonquetella anthropi]|uniref:type II toxin-antitoxin system RelB/DinJ family antitoxin n=1 Tax=Jonquetella anthropi TaxID=428712 RepID=UPI0001B911F3|nr:type II toxin-antitoxin system RelB/DinJ family antitoxin [Jonquetella anthropi]EEX47855.1 addiction module antitoxin, RelB/DinJ family [Jonquetella anthropi E3_33 E1]